MWVSCTSTHALTLAHSQKEHAHIRVLTHIVAVGVDVWHWPVVVESERPETAGHHARDVAQLFLQDRGRTERAGEWGWARERERRGHIPHPTSHIPYHSDVGGSVDKVCVVQPAVVVPVMRIRAPTTHMQCRDGGSSKVSSKKGGGAKRGNKKGKRPAEWGNTVEHTSWCIPRLDDR